MVVKIACEGALYVYDVFLSYRRGRIHSEWLVDPFIPLFKDRLREEVADLCHRYDQGLFHDENEVMPGTLVADNVTRGLKTARCLLALLSPSYFLSPWCLVEWDSFWVRGQSEARDLVVPVIVSPGATVMAKVDGIMCADLSAYTIVGDGFKKTRRYVKLQDEIKRLARRVAEVVANAPDWKEFEICNPPRSQVVPPAPIPRGRLG